MPRQRLPQNANLPKYVRLKNGTYYLEPKGTLKEALENKSSIKLGDTHSDMLQKHHQIMSSLNQNDRITTFPQLVDRYLLEYSLKMKAASSYKIDCRRAKKMKIAFASFKPNEVRDDDIDAYISKRRQTIGPAAANREIALLSSIFRRAVKWKLVTNSPCVDMDYFQETPRERNISHPEFDAFYKFAREINPTVAAYIFFKYLTGRRDCELLGLQMKDITEAGIYLKVAQKKLGGGSELYLMAWSDALREAVTNLYSANSQKYRTTVKHKDIKDADPEEYLIQTTRGTRYTADGWRTIFHKLMTKAVSQGVLKEKFHCHDIRAKSATDTNNVDVAHSLLAHKDIKTTKIYMRAGIPIVPLR
jgi:integrase